MLEGYLNRSKQEKPILLMTHIVIGYPDFDSSMKLVEGMVEAGVDLMELQIPFSEPIADGPVILHANQKALSAGATVERCLRFAEKASAEFDIPLLFMSYYNILFKYGVGAFVAEMKRIGMRGAIVPDLPPEEADEYLTAMRKNELDPIFIFTPNTTEQRLHTIARHASGFLYCVARKGVTGAETSFTGELDRYLARCRRATRLPLALGFGVKDKTDVDFLTGKVDIAVVGSQTLRVLEERGVEAASDFVESLR